MKKPGAATLSLPNRTLACSTAGGPFESILILKDTVVGASAKRLVTWSRKSGALLTDRALPVDGAPTLSPTGDLLVLLRPAKTPGDFTNVSTWRVTADSFEPIGAEDVPGKLRAVCISPDERYVAWSAFDAEPNGHHRAVRDTKLAPIGRFPAAGQQMKTGGVAVSADAFAVAEKGLVQVFDLPSMTPRWQAELVGAESLRYGPDGTLYGSTSKGLIAAYDAAGRQTWKSGAGRDSFPWILVGGGLVVAGGGNGVLEAATGTSRAQIGATLSALAIAADGGEVGTSPVDRPNIVELWTIPPPM